MKKLGLKMNVAGWIVFGISFMIPDSWAIWVKGIACGLFISSIWTNVYEYKNQ